MKLIKMFCSIYTTIVLLAIYGILCAVATFIEADAAYGIQAAQDMIYRSTLFNVVHFLLLLNLIAVFVYRKVWKSKKYYSIILHVSFIVILIGATLTRFYGFEGLMHIKETQSSNVILTDSDYLNIRVSDNNQIYYSKLPVRYNSVTQTQLNETIPFKDSSLNVKFNSYNSGTMEIPASINITASYNGESKSFDLPQSYLDANIGQILKLGGLDFQFVWGPASIPVPFEIYLKDFELTRYPGSKSPSSYKSYITVKDYTDNSTFDYEIFMNNVLDYKGYRFFQSSYDHDEKGTILSINKDPGKIPTYIGYFLLTVGFLLSFFGKNSRVWQLGQYLKQQKLYVFLIAFSSFFLLGSSLSYAQEQSMENNKTAIETQDEHTSHSDVTETHIHDSHATMKMKPTQEEIDTLVKNISKNMGPHSKKVAKILIQDMQGRIKPLDTLAMDMMHKLIRKDSFQGMNHVEFFLGMMMYYDYFQEIKMFSVRDNELKKILGVPETEKYVAFSDVFDKKGQYKLQMQIERASEKNPAYRTKFDKDLIKFNEKISIAYAMYTAQMFLIFPDITGNTTGLLSPGIAMATFDKENTLKLQDMLQSYFKGVDEGIKNNNWQDADKYLAEISDFQHKYGAKLMPASSKITVEVLMNKYNPFKNLTYVYVLLGIIMFIFVMAAIIKNKPVNEKLGKIFVIITTIAAVLHTLALISRWYIAGHAPWSNAYESMIYIAWAGALAGVLFFRKSLLAISATNFVSGITLFVANLGFMDPQIGTLVPVLKSYWLNIHVSVITASYGFFGLSFVLGVISMILFSIRNPSKPHIDQSIINVHCINEVSMLLGLGMLTVGTFLGGVWANESWGRYWGWDPKETWSLITIIVYTIILHTRLINKLNKPYILAVLSTLGFYTVLMTYFGVNFYLAGMHSYASGEPVPIPTFLYVMVAIHLILIGFSFLKRDVKMPSLLTRKQNKEEE